MNDLKFAALPEGCFVTLVGPRDEVGKHAIPVSKSCNSFAAISNEIDRLKHELDEAKAAAQHHFGRP
jgi:hypothetical protein